LDLNRHSEGQVLPADPETKELSLGAQARCVDVSADGSLCAVGFRDGSFSVYKTSNWKNNWKMAAAKKGPMKEWLEDIKFSPDNRYIASAPMTIKFMYLHSQRLLCTAHSLPVAPSSAISTGLQTPDT